MKQLSLSLIASFCSGRLEGSDITIENISTDSRSLGANDLFIPIVGERFDGHDFLCDASKKCAAVLSARDISLSVPVIRVDDTTKAYLDIAALYKGLFDLKTVGLTGSTGKTTTKELTASILSKRYSTLRTEGNYNNHVGVPLTLLRLDDTVERAVVEMGMNHPGEISVLTRAVRPDVAIITNVGSMHLEFLGTRDNILKAKTEIFEGLAPGGAAVLNADDDKLYPWGKNSDLNIIWFGIDSPEADYRAADIEEHPDSSDFTLVCPLGERRMHLAAAGRHNIMNALAACAAAAFVGADLDDMASALAAFENTGSRQKVFNLCGTVLMDDCYNAGPDSVAAALGVLKNLKARRHIAVLGDMLELGEQAEDLHRVTLEKARSFCSRLFLYGPIMGSVSRDGEHFASHEELVKALCEYSNPGDAVLFKGSHGMHMEKALSLFVEEIKCK